MKAVIALLAIISMAGCTSPSSLSEQNEPDNSLLAEKVPPVVAFGLDQWVILDLPAAPNGGVVSFYLEVPSNADQGNLTAWGNFVFGNPSYDNFSVGPNIESLDAWAGIIKADGAAYHSWFNARYGHDPEGAAAVSRVPIYDEYAGSRLRIDMMIQGGPEQLGLVYQESNSHLNSDFYWTWEEIEESRGPANQTIPIPLMTEDIHASFTEISCADLALGCDTFSWGMSAFEVSTEDNGDSAIRANMTGQGYLQYQVFSPLGPINSLFTVNGNFLETPISGSAAKIVHGSGTGIEINLPFGGDAPQPLGYPVFAGFFMIAGETGVKYFDPANLDVAPYYGSD